MTTARTTTLFPRRTPEPTEAMSSDDYQAFRAWHETPSGRAFYDAMAIHVAERIGVCQGRIVSVGEGEGAFAARLASLLPHVEVVGLDVSEEVVRAAKATHRAPNLRFEAGAATDLSRQGPAEAVVVMQAFHHFEEPARALRAMYDVLSPGGSLLVIDLRRDADSSAYLRRLDGYLGAERFAKARLLRASVAAAHTGQELLALAAPLRGDARLCRFRWTQSAQAAYGQVDPDSLANVVEDLSGLMVELHLIRPSSRRTGGAAHAGSSPRPTRARGAKGPAGPPPSKAGLGAVGTILWSAEGEQLWTDPGAREQGRRCPAGWGELLALDARQIAQDPTAQQVIERRFTLDAHSHIVARSGWCDGTGGVAVVTTLTEVHTAMDLSALVARCGITAREVDVARLAAAGLGNREIGVRLGVAAPTVGNHLTALYQKTGTSGRLELARLVLLADREAATAGAPERREARGTRHRAVATT